MSAVGITFNHCEQMREPVNRSVLHYSCKTAKSENKCVSVIEELEAITVTTTTFAATTTTLTAITARTFRFQLFGSDSS